MRTAGVVLGAAISLAAAASSIVSGCNGNTSASGSDDRAPTVSATTVTVRPDFSYPWHDNYCKTRSWDMPLCPSGSGHQGQDIRAASCVKGVHWAVAVVDGTITSIGSYSVYLTAADGTRFDYLHMQDVQVKEGQKVKRGDRGGKVSNQFNGEATTVHLHFDIRQSIAGVGMVYVPSYLSLVESYETLEASESGCIFAPGSVASRNSSFGDGFILLALGLVAARRRR